jgi:ABC-2 type transport system ATP-binding protein
VDTTSNLLKKHASQTLSLQLSGVLPISLQTLVLKSLVSEFRYTLRLASPSDLEHILASCRLDGLMVLDCSIDKPDLEDVFVQIMGDSSL